LNASPIRRGKARPCSSSGPLRARENPCRSMWAGVSRCCSEPDGRGSSIDIGATVLGLWAGRGRRCWRQPGVGASEAVELAERVVERPDADHLQAAGAAASLLDLGGRDEEQFRSRLARGDRLLLGATDGPAGAVGPDGSGDGDLLPAREVPRGELVDDGERERESGRGPADAAGVDVDVDGKVELLAARGALDADLGPALARPLGGGAGVD